MAGGPEGHDVVAARLARIARAGAGVGGVRPAEVSGSAEEPGSAEVPGIAEVPGPGEDDPGRGVVLAGWVPEPPVPALAPARSALRPTWPEVRPADDALPHDPVADDATAARRALSAAMASYTAAHGHPLSADDAAGPRRFRLAVGARVAVAAVVALLLVVGVVAVRAWQRTQAAAVPLAQVTAPTADDDGAAAATSAGGATGDAVVGSVPAVVVHVVGEVASPGVVALEPGARVADAVAAAGGATPSADLTAINLARVLADGEQVVVPAPGQATAAASGGGGVAGTGGSGLVDLNRADAAAFDTLPGIGPVLAERIVAWRDAHGRFTAVEELTEVTGIGPALLAGVRDLVQVG